MNSKIQMKIFSFSGLLFAQKLILFLVWKSVDLYKKKKKKKRKLYTKSAAKEAVLLRVKSSSDDDPGFRHGFGAEASLPLTQGAPAVSHNTTRLYWTGFNLYECHIHSDAVTVLFWIFFIYSLFFAGVSQILLKNVAVAFEIKPRHLKRKYVCWPVILSTLFRSSYYIYIYIGYIYLIHGI